MKQLLWKEWRELRFVPVACITTLIAFVLVAKSYNLMTREEWATTSLSMLFMLWPLAGLLTGCNVFSSEVGNGTMQFLTSLPLSRARVWWAKFLAGLVILSGTMALTLAGWAVATVVCAGTKAFATADLIMNSDSLVNGITIPFWIYGVSLIVSPLVDRPLTSAAITVATCLGIQSLFEEIGHVYWNQLHLIGPHSYSEVNFIGIALMAVSIPAFLTASYWAVTQCETLRSVRRFYITGGVLLAWCMAALVTVAIYFGQFGRI